MVNIKAAPWDDINFRFSFCNEVVYHPDHDFIFFRFFRFFKLFFINIFMKPLKTQTNFVYTQTLAKVRLNVPTALGHMLMSSAQRWADNQCCRCITPCPDYKTPISGDCSDLMVQDVGKCDVKCCILVTCFVYMAIYDLEI